jgi:hypothetical protein
VEEEFQMKRYNQYRDVPNGQQWRVRRQSRCRRGRARVRGLAHLASCFVLSLFVRVGGSLREKYNEHKRQGKCQHPGQVLRRFSPASHLSSQVTPALARTQDLCQQ